MSRVQLTGLQTLRGFHQLLHTHFFKCECTVKRTLQQVITNTLETSRKTGKMQHCFWIKRLGSYGWVVSLTCFLAVRTQTGQQTPGLSSVKQGASGSTDLTATWLGLGEAGSRRS